MSSFLDALLTGGSGVATDLATTGANVNVGDAAPPVGSGQVFVTTSSTAGHWVAASSIGSGTAMSFSAVITSTAELTAGVINRVDSSGSSGDITLTLPETPSHNDQLAVLLVDSGAHEVLVTAVSPVEIGNPLSSDTVSSFSLEPSGNYVELKFDQDGNGGDGVWQVIGLAKGLVIAGLIGNPEDFTDVSGAGVANSGSLLVGDSEGVAIWMSPGDPGQLLTPHAEGGLTWTDAPSEVAGKIGNDDDFTDVSNAGVAELGSLLVGDSFGNATWINPDHDGQVPMVIEGGLSFQDLPPSDTVINIDSDTTATAGGIYLVDSSDDVVTVTLPAAASSTDRKVTVKRKTGSNSVVIDANASETIDGATTLTLTQAYEWATLVCDGSEWSQVS